MRTATSPRVILSLLATVLIAAYGATAHAQSSDRVGMSFKAPEGEFTVGEVVPLTLEATYPAGFQVILPVLPRSWGAFEVRSQSPAAVEDRDDGSSSISQTIEIVLFAPGEHSTPELLVTVRDPSGKMTDIAAPMATVQVSSPCLAKTTSISGTSGLRRMSQPLRFGIYLRISANSGPGLRWQGSSSVRGGGSRRLLHRRRAAAGRPYPRRRRSSIRGRLMRRRGTSWTR